MSIQLHETVMGRRLIEHTLPKIGNALEKIAKGMEKREKEWYVVFTATHDLFNEGKTIDNTQMFESKEEAKVAYEKAMKLENLHSAGMARLMEGTDWA
jgi:hypothetical protein